MAWVCIDFFFVKLNFKLNFFIYVINFLFERSDIESNIEIDIPDFCNMDWTHHELNE